MPHKKILEKFIEISPVLGINNDTLLRSCVLVNALDQQLYFPNGVQSVLEEIEIYVTQKAIEKTNLNEKSISNRIENLIKNRLLVYSEFKNYREFLKKKKCFSYNPKNSLFTLKQVYKISDDLWYAIGDTSTNFSFYTKRMILAKLHNAVISKFVNDYSYQYEDTFNFLHDKINNIVNFSRFKTRLKKFF